MSIDVHHELEALQGMTVPELQARYAELFGEEIRTHHKQRLVRRILWRLQALAQGDLSERARRRAAALADDAHLRLEPPKPPATPVTLPSTDQRLPAPGTVITRLYKGQLLQVTVLAEGFSYGGERFGSLSAVAKHITGSHCNGYQFFGLAAKGRKQS